MPLRFSAIDIGSNAIRMIVGEFHGHKWQILKKLRSPVRLGHDVFSLGQITDKTLKEAQETFKEFSSLNKKMKVDLCRAVGTSALREAKNRKEFIEKIDHCCQIRVEVIDGKREAQLIYSAVCNEIDLSDKKAMLIDIGGGSVEITISHNEKILSSQSFPLGTVRMLEASKKRNLSEDHLNVVIGEMSEPLFRHLERETRGEEFDFAVGTGGNLEAMARLKMQLLHKTPNTFVSLGELRSISQVLKKHSLKERIEKLKMRPDRADVILPAIILVKMVLRQSGIEKILIPGVGLRDGLLWSAAALQVNAKTLHPRKVAP